MAQNPTGAVTTDQLQPVRQQGPCTHGGSWPTGKDHVLLCGEVHMERGRRGRESAVWRTTHGGVWDPQRCSVLLMSVLATPCPSPGPRVSSCRAFSRRTAQPHAVSSACSVQPACRGCGSTWRWDRRLPRNWKGVTGAAHSAWP